MKRKIISVFEHSIIRVGDKFNFGKPEEKNSVIFDEKHLQELQKFHGSNELPFYKLVNKGIKLTEFVGVLQVGNLIIEVLPKADKNDENKEFDTWRKTLIGMLRAVGAFNIHAPSSSSLSIKSNFLLDLYFELFVKEVEYLFNMGLIKKYRRTEGNSFALKGNILFGKHLQKNITHQERFYIKQSTYDKEHLLHQILYKTLLLLKVINTNVALSSRIGNLLLNFPEMLEIKVTELTFNKIVLHRKTEEYKNAIEISKLLLLNYHPDLCGGQNNVLALMFDMNLLWEQFIYVTLRKYLSNYEVKKQTSKNFWKPKNGNRTTIRPDIFITYNKENYVVDTKWKNLGGNNPSSSDLQQMYVYHDYFETNKVALVYPGVNNIISGNYYKADGQNRSDKQCSVISINSQSDIYQWQGEISCKIKNWLKND